MKRVLLPGTLVSIILFVIQGASFADNLGDHEVTLWHPYLEWTLENPSYEGNPFDLVATVVFTHKDSGKTHVTEMFYAGGKQWKFRFTGTKVGAWTFKTTSADPELNGHSGSITVTPNPDPKIRGFLTHVGNKFAIQGADEDDPQGYYFQVYMNQYILPHREFPNLADPAIVEAVYENTRANGFEIAFTSLNHHWLKKGALRHDEHKSVNPDLETFAILDSIITSAHARGMRWHMWAWGDEARKWTPIGLPGGVNGEVDRRLQRYIAARLGPLPGWTMGYGFDLMEWTTPEGRDGWAKYMHEKMGWDHLLCTRGFKLHGSENNIVSYSGFGGNDLTTTAHGPADFAEVLQHMQANPEAPSFYEERHSYKRDGFKLDMEGTRRLRWWQAMSGGMGGFFGFYSRSEHPYPNPEQLRTVQTFWQDRFSLDLNPAAGIADTPVLKSTDGTRFIIYAENSTSIAIDLSGMKGKQKAVAVDTAQSYKEIPLKTLKAEKQTITLPHASDWAIAIGEYTQ